RATRSQGAPEALAVRVVLGFRLARQHQAAAQRDGVGAQTEAGGPGALVVLEGPERLEQIGAASDEPLGRGAVADLLRNGVGFGEVGAGGGQDLGAHGVLALRWRLRARS